MYLYADRYILPNNDDVPWTQYNVMVVNRNIFSGPKVKFYYLNEECSNHCVCNGVCSFFLQQTA